MKMYLVRFSLLVVVLLVQSIGSLSARESGKSSVFSLFNLKEKSRFWSEAVIRGDIRDVESKDAPGKMGVLNYTRSGNIANYLRLLELDCLYLPVPVNFIFIGFEGNGNQEFKVHPEELERWFMKIDHFFEHSRVPKIGEVLTPFDKINIDRRQHRDLAFTSHISYNFSVHAIQMGEKVTSIIEQATKAFGRRDGFSVDRDDAEIVWQVDVDLMDVLFTSLVEYLQLHDTYNVFVLNHKRDAKWTKYGYRRGLSESELNFLKEDKDLQRKILHEGRNASDRLLALDNIKKPLYGKRPLDKFAWTVTEETDTVEWYNIWLDLLTNYEKSHKGEDTADTILTKTLQLLNGKNREIKLPLMKDLKSGDFDNYRAECLTDLWIGMERWAFIDLTAGPFSWGPAVGGEGVRTDLSLPNVEKTIGAVEEISADEAEDRLQDAIQEKFAVFGDKDHQAIDILLAEIDIYELFAFKHCKGRKVKLALCEELDERMRDLKDELQSFDGQENDETIRRKAIEALKRMENWNLFSDAHEDFQNYTVARDIFLAHLGATLWGSLRHIISPSLSDGAFHYYEKISYQLFFITQEKVRHIRQLPVDLQTVQDGLSSLLLPSQKAMFSQHLLPLSEDNALAMAFSVARRAAAFPLLLVNGTYRKTVRSYLDSAILQYQLQRYDHASLKGSHANSRSTLEVPIFWFIQSDPLLVDMHYQATSLSDMIVVVQSELPSWESHLQCNGKSVLWDLRSPVKAAIAAASEHLTGLLPLHLVYSQAHETAIEEWTWSVGCSPFAITSQGWCISGFQSDTISRSYIITTLEESIRLINSAIRLLAMEHTTEKTFKIFQSQERELVKKYNNAVSLWRRISTVSGELRYVDAMRLLHTLEDASKRFSDQVNATISLLHPIRCTKDRNVDVVFDSTTVPAFLIVLGVLYLVLKPRRPKPKIN